jgi:hypothetical protein
LGEKAGTPLPAGDGENGFLDLGHRVMSDLLELDMRHVRHLVRNHDGVDDSRPVDGQGFAQRGFQFTRLARVCPATLRGAKSISPASRSMLTTWIRRLIGSIGAFDPLAWSRQEAV